MKAIMSLRSEMRDITSSIPDAVLGYAANMGNFYDSALPEVSDSQYDELNGILDKLGGLEAPESLYDANESLKEYVKIIKELINYSKEKNPENKLDREDSFFMSELDLYKEKIEQINSDFSNYLIKYFMEKEVYWESIYGENEIINFLLY